MRAVILAAGSGKRMRPLTFTTHKTLLQVGSERVIDRIVDGLVENGINDIVVVTGYRARELSSYLSERYSHLKLQFIHNERYDETNNIFSMALALEQMPLGEDVVLIESDLIYEPSVLTRLLKSPHANVALVDRYRSGMDGTVVTCSDGVITGVIPSHLQSGDFSFRDKFKTLNIYRFSADFWQGVFRQLVTYYARAIDSNCYYEIVLGIIVAMQKEKVYAEILDGERWAEVDDPNDLDGARFIFEKEARGHILEKTRGAFWHYDITDFCYMRNMHFPTGAIISELQNNFPALIKSYGSTEATLARKLSYFLLTRPEHVLLLSGACEAYPMLGQLLSDYKVLHPAPTFGEYNRVFPKSLTYADEIGIDFGEVERQTPQADVVIFVNPNNPTGSLVRSADILGLAQRYPEKVFIVDESFLDFSDEPSLIPALEESPLANVIVLKSLSKAFGVPGLRLGFLYSAGSPLLKELRAMLPIWHVNSIAEHMLELLLKHRNALAASFQQTKADRQHLVEQLAQLPLVVKTYPSGGNFVLAELSCGRSCATRIAEDLIARAGIYLKDISERFRDGKAYYRIAVRTQKEHIFLAQELSKSVRHLNIQLSDNSLSRRAFGKDTHAEL